LHQLLLFKVSFLESQHKKKEERGGYQKGVEPMVDLVSKIHMACCKFCSMVENKEKLLNLKLDDLQKHARKKKFSFSFKSFSV
jgi:hypothetical protein